MMKRLSKKFSIIFLLISIAFTFNYQKAFSANETEDIQKSIQNVVKRAPSSIPTIGGTADAESKTSYLIFKIIDAMLIIAGILAVFFITISGVRFVVASGSQDQIDAAKRTLTWSVAGLFVVILSWAIISNVVDIIYQDQQAGEECRTPGCPCLFDSDCDSGRCSDSATNKDDTVSAIGTNNGNSLIKVCQPN